MKSTSLKRLVLVCAVGCLGFGYSGLSTAQEGVSAARGVSVESTYLNNLFVHQWVKLDPSGRIVGNVVGLEPGQKMYLGGVPVHLISNDVVVHTAVTQPDGSFTMSGVKHGSYALVARNSSAIGAFLVSVLAADAGEHLPSDIEVRVVNPASDVSRIIRQQSVPGLASAYPVAPETDPLSTSRMYHSGPVVTTRNGVLYGRVAVPGSVLDLSNVSVYLLRDGREVARASVSESGEFSVAGLTSGVYGLIAAGDSGFAAVSFELANPAVPVKGGEKLIAAVQAADAIYVELVPTSSIVVSDVVLTDEVAVSEMPFAPIAGGTSMGGFSGGGGGFGGGGWAGLAGIGGLIAAVAIVASDDEPKETSPIKPPTD